MIISLWLYEATEDADNISGVKTFKVAGKPFIKSLMISYILEVKVLPSFLVKSSFQDMCTAMSLHRHRWPLSGSKGKIGLLYRIIVMSTGQVRHCLLLQKQEQWAGMLLPLPAP